MAELSTIVDVGEVLWGTDDPCCLSNLGRDRCPRLASLLLGAERVCLFSFQFRGGFFFFAMTTNRLVDVDYDLLAYEDSYFYDKLHLVTRMILI